MSTLPVGRADLSQLRRPDSHWRRHHHLLRRHPQDSESHRGGATGPAHCPSARAAAGAQELGEGVKAEPDWGTVKMTQQNSALVEQSAAAADGLKDLAVGLAQAVGHFKLDRLEKKPAEFATLTRLSVSTGATLWYRLVACGPEQFTPKCLLLPPHRPLG